MKIILISALLLLVISASYFYRKNRAKNKVIHVTGSYCTGCWHCLKICRHQVLDMVKDWNGLHIEVKYPEKCVACGHCLDICKFNALELINREKPENKDLYPVK